MFSAILLVQNDDAGAVLEHLAIESKEVLFVKSFDRMPRAHELTRTFNNHNADLAFLDLSDWDTASMAAMEIRAISPRTAIIGFGAGWKVEHEAQFALAGISEVLVSPVTLKKFTDAIDHAIHKTSSAVQENVFAFLPSKAGSGSSTISLNLAGYLADNAHRDSLGKKVLLIDGDLNSGIMWVLLDSLHPYSLRDALENSSQLDFSIWSKYVARHHHFDVLLSDHRRRMPLPSWSNYHHLLDFAAARYDNILVDLPEVVNDATVETVRRAKHVFIVCTPELASLALAPCRSEELTSRGIPPAKISLILNRWHKGEITAADLEKKLKIPVSAVFGNDYPAVSRASAARGIVSNSTKLGKSLGTFAKQLAATTPDSSDKSMLSFLKGFGMRATPQPQA